MPICYRALEQTVDMCVDQMLYARILNVWRHVREKNRFVSRCEGVASEGRVVGLPKFHSWGKCTTPLTNINSDWMSNASSGLWITLHYVYYAGPLFRILGSDPNIQL